VLGYTLETLARIFVSVSPPLSLSFSLFSPPLKNTRLTTIQLDPPLAALLDFLMRFVGRSPYRATRERQFVILAPMCRIASPNPRERTIREYHARVSTFKTRARVLSEFPAGIEATEISLRQYSPKCTCDTDVGVLSFQLSLP